MARYENQLAPGLFALSGARVREKEFNDGIRQVIETKSDKNCSATRRLRNSLRAALFALFLWKRFFFLHAAGILSEAKTKSFYK